MAEKLEALKSLLKVWNKEVFGEVEDNKREALVKFRKMQNPL